MDTPPAPEGTRQPRPKRLRNVVVLLIIISLVLVLLYGYTNYDQTKPQTSIVLLSDVMQVYSPSNSTEYGSALFWVENTGATQITSLSGSVDGELALEFNTSAGPINATNPLHPGEFGLDLVNVVSQALPFQNSSNYPVSIKALSSTGKSMVNGTVADEILNTPVCGDDPNQTLSFQTQSLSVDNSSDLATWVVSLSTTTPDPVNAISVGVNNGSVWIPVPLDGQSISPTNQLHAGTEVTATFTWTYVSDTHQYLEWIGSCANQNALSTIGAPG